MGFNSGFKGLTNPHPKNIESYAVPKGHVLVQVICHWRSKQYLFLQSRFWKCIKKSINVLALSTVLTVLSPSQKRKNLVFVHYFMPLIYLHVSVLFPHHKILRQPFWILFMRKWNEQGSTVLSGTLDLQNCINIPQLLNNIGITEIKINKSIHTVKTYFIT